MAKKWVVERLVKILNSGWMVSTYALGYFLFALISEPISDGLVKKKVLVWRFLAFGILAVIRQT